MTILDTSTMDKPLFLKTVSLLNTSSLLLVAILVSFVPGAGTEKILGVDDGEFDFDGLPGAQHEFKVHVPAMREDCFFQPVTEGAKFHVNFEVLKGGDKKMDFYVRNPHGEAVYYQQYSERGSFDMDNTNAGVYAVCFHNAFARFGSKVVFVYIVTFVMQEWIQYHHELATLNLVAHNFTNSLSSVQESVEVMKKSQAETRFNVIRDWYLVTGNNYYVSVYSLVQCVLIVGASLIQVFSVRRLFKTTNVTPSHKPRA